MKVKPQQQQPAANKKRRNRRRRKQGGGGPSNTISSDGVITVKRAELFCEITAEAKGTTSASNNGIWPTTEVLPWLQKLSKNFSQIVWKSIKIEYRPAVGTMKDGSLVVGIEWNDDGITPTKASVQNCTPNFQTPVWQRKEMVLPSSRLQSRKFFSLKSTDLGVDRMPGSLVTFLSCSAGTGKQYFGDIWLHYHVVLMGPT
uniref:Capsid protein n=1 Tax=Atrato Sobemo-like virus 5 TaxID=2689351 RepID=A0A6B9KGC9_9VIRU|nr:putative coat protein [Atrato Sobemo-like virus 5]